MTERYSVKAIERNVLLTGVDGRQFIGARVELERPHPVTGEPTQDFVQIEEELIAKTYPDEQAYINRCIRFHCGGFAS